MRVFIALPVGKGVNNELVKLQEALKPKVPGRMKWTEPENFHLTVEFLGELKEEKLEEVKWVLSHHAKLNSAFTCRVENLDAFPHLSHAQTLVVKVQEVNGEQSKNMRKLMHEEMHLMGLTQDYKPWKPHLTLARIKTSAAPDLSHSLKDVTVPKLEWQVDRLKLIESNLTQEGPKYIILATYPLT